MVLKKAIIFYLINFDSFKIDSRFMITSSSSFGIFMKEKLTRVFGFMREICFVSNL
ncbi:MAG: hypothetical protein UT61_C0021G0003 [Candidatus Woesebacteria bacterium GW2011_GWA1_39_8]|uniref:Uncharacterized protein n=1 Tax=Candidatus Woesebacteria bacterium GW2011_GWA1_39_8 TaxID=1618552 RepID=A0A0G0SW30_9BACT|nr:MAG: hypothetical protein UT61_C0021G0003 [Candidatus Woesebacteria bacterium GW2011_GWA1_39_8]